MALGRTVAELGDMDLGEYMDWQAYEHLEPWGPEVDALNSAVVASTVAAAHSDRRSSIRFADFMPLYQRRPRRMSEQEMRSNFLAAKAAIERGRAGG